MPAEVQKIFDGIGPGWDGSRAITVENVLGEFLFTLDEGEEWLEREKLPKHETKRVNVRLLRVLVDRDGLVEARAKNLRRAVLDITLETAADFLFGEIERQTKIGNFDCPILSYEQVGELEIAMDDIVSVEPAETACDIVTNLETKRQGLDLCQTLFQVSARQKLRDNDHLVQRVQARSNQQHHIRMLQTAHELQLFQGRFRVLFSQLLLDDFASHREVVVLRFVDISILTFSYLLNQHEILPLDRVVKVRLQNLFGDARRSFVLHAVLDENLHEHIYSVFTLDTLCVLLCMQEAARRMKSG